MVLGRKGIVIGQGEPERARDYIQRNNNPCPLLCDPTFEVNKAFDIVERKTSQILFDGPNEYLIYDLKAGRVSSAKQKARLLIAPGNFQLNLW